MSLFTAASIAVVSYLVIEIARYQKHRINLKKIKNRIHINGTRGKSSVTRLIYHGLKANPQNIVVAKTTGTEPRFIFPNGNEVPVARPGKPNIIEQLRIIDKAVKLQANFFLTECMAITPEYIKILEEKVIKSNVGVITNIREDHLDTLGPTINDVAENLSLSIPRNGVAFTSEKKYFNVLLNKAKKRRTELIWVDPKTVDERILNKFSYIEHKENIALALAVCEHFGIKKKSALSYMLKAHPDPGALERYIIESFGKKIVFYSAFAANDPESTIRIWEKFSRNMENKILIFVVRIDRPSRTESFLKFLGDRLKADFYILGGEPLFIVKNSLMRKGIPSDRIIPLGNTTPEEIFNKVLLLTPKESLCIGIGNTVGLGSRIKEFFKSRSGQ